MKNQKNFDDSKDRILKHLKIIERNNQFYQRIFKEKGIILDDNFDYDMFKKIPVLTKDIFRSNQKEIESSLEGKKTWDVCTSGSSGKQMTFRRSYEDNVRMFYGLNHYRNKICSGIVNEKGIFFHYMYYKKMEDQYKRDDFPFIKEAQNFYRFGYFYLGDDVYERCIQCINEEKPSWIVGQPSFMFEFAKYICKQGGLKHHVKYIETNSEYLSEETAQVIEKAFNVMPRSLYASSELISIGIQCECGNMHVMSENVFVEIDEHSKKVIVTSLNNYFTPFIRYELGDVAEWDNNICNCRMRGPILKLSGFRSSDFFIVEEGKKIEVWHFHEVFRKLQKELDIKILQYKIIQYKNGVKFYLVLGVLECSKRNMIFSRLSDEVNDVFQRDTYIKVEYVDEIEPDVVTGKIRFFISKLDEEIDK